MNDLINKGKDFFRNVRDKLTDRFNEYKGDNGMTNGLNWELSGSFEDIKENKKIGPYNSIHVFGVGKYGKASEDGWINGGCFDSCSLNVGAVMVLCEGKENTKKGVIGARLAKNVALSLINSIDEDAKNEEIFLNHITSSGFKAIFKAMWQEKATIYIEELQLKRKQRELDEKELDINEELKEYASSITIAFITDNYYTIGGIGEGGVLLYNEFEGKRVLTGNKDAILLGEGKTSLCFKKYPRSDFGGLLFTSNKLGTMLYDNKLLYKVAIELEKQYVKSKATDSSDIWNNDEIKRVADECRDSGLMIALLANKHFQLPAEKYREYKEHIYKKQREDAERNRNELIKKNLELAKDKTLYDTYDATKYDILPELTVFKARRQGRGHIEKNNGPCQDYCISDSVSKGIILADADGLGSCKRSEYGSKFACEAVVSLIKTLDKQSENEEIFVSRLQGLVFRERLVNNWLGMVVDHIQENPFERENPNGYLEYASTLMFAVITEHYYVVGCLGDGQVLLFNDYEGVKLRLHDVKEDTATNSLVNHNCAREDFIIAKYNRCDFDGLLLTTDGMYDGQLSYVNELYKYAKEIKDRFVNANEPLQPFCYTLQGEMMDMYSHRTKDDCSIVLAVNSIKASGRGCIDKLNEIYDLVIPQVINDTYSTYVCKKGEGEYLVIASKEKAEDIEIDGVKFIKPLNSFLDNGYSYNEYELQEKLTLEQLYHYSKLGEKNEITPNASAFTLDIYNELLELNKILNENNYSLRKGFTNLIYFDNEFYVYPEAIKAGKNENCKLSYFDSLIGKIVNGKREIPVFNTGFRSKGQRKHLTEYNDGPTFAIVSRDNRYYMENTDNEPWIMENGDTIRRGERILLNKELSFRIRGEGVFTFKPF